jgi:hypothetical protein
MSGVTAIPECPGWICPDGFGQSDPLTLELDAPNAAYRYRANLALDLVSQTTTGGGVVILYLAASVDGGKTFNDVVKNSHQIGNGMDQMVEGRQAQVWLPLSSGQSLGIDNRTTTNLQLRARAHLISGSAGTVIVSSNETERGDGYGDCSDPVSGLNGTIHMELEECL